MQKAIDNNLDGDLAPQFIGTWRTREGHASYIALTRTLRTAHQPVDSESDVPFPLCTQGLSSTQYAP